MANFNMAPNPGRLCKNEQRTFRAVKPRRTLQHIHEALRALVSPAAPRATGACSRDEPQPKFCPPIMIGYSVFISPSFTYLRKSKTQTGGFDDLATSVSRRGSRRPHAGRLPGRVGVIRQADQCVAAQLLVLIRLLEKRARDG